MKKKISIVTPCYNEEDNVIDLVAQVRDVFSKLPNYDYEHLFIDNASTDETQVNLRRMAAEDKRIKIIFNARNFGPVRSPFYGITQAFGDAVVLLVADLQDPPALIADFVAKWEAGYKVVMAVKSKSEESPVFFAVRKLYYTLVRRMADIKLIDNYYGFGLYDKKIIDILRTLDDPYPYFRGMIPEIGFDAAIVEYTQSNRKRGFTKMNFFSLYDSAMLGFTSHARVPLRLATLFGFLLSFFCILVSLVYLVYKLLYWYDFQSGIAPLVIGVFFLSGVQLFFIGMLGEYVMSIQTRALKRPLIVERERVNFESS